MNRNRGMLMPVAVSMLVVILLAMVAMVMKVVDASKRVKNDISIIVLDFYFIGIYAMGFS
jgi:hypothetical protein